MKKYRYYIVDSLLVQTEVFPINDGTQQFEFSKKEPAGLYFEKKLTGKLVFSNNSKNSIVDFNYFKDKETNSKCEELEIRIFKLCGTTYSLFWEGYFSVLEGSFDNDRCSYEVTPRIKYNIQSDLEINILDADQTSGSYNFRTGNLLAGTERIYSNGVGLYQALLYIAQQSNFRITDVVSDFFSINPVGDIDYADYYLPIANYSQLVLAPLSEIQEPVPSNRAVKEFVSLDNLMADLNVLFDVYWFIDSNFQLRIEHSVFFEKDLGLDLTNPIYSKYLVGSNKISYNLDDFPKYETFRIANSKQYCRISYFGCGEINKNKNEITYETGTINTDYYDIRYNGGGSDSSGLFLFACYQSLGIFRMRENALGQNYLLQAPLLVEYFKRYNRPSNNNSFEYYQSEIDLQTIEINQGSFLAYSIKPTKIQEDISFPICCDVEFDASKKITTSIGVGYLDSAKYDMRNSTLKLKLKYKAENDNVEILPNQLTGCRLWLTADTGVVYTNVSGVDRVSQWQDQSGYNNHAVQTNPSDRPIYDSTSKYLKFYSNFFLETPFFQLFPSKRGSVFILGNFLPTGVVGTGLMSIISTSVGNQFDASISIIFNPPPPIGGSNSRYLLSANLAQLFPRQTYTGLIQINRESDTTQTMYSNGLKPSVLTGNPLTIANLQVTSAPLIIGKNASYADTGPEQLFEVICFDRVLNDLERQQIELYIIKKWGIELYQEF